MGWNVQQAIAENGAFNAYLSRNPVLAEAVYQKVAIVERALGATSVGEVLAGRDAMASLHMTAHEAGFAVLACLFYESYESFCSRLLEYL
jgi:hypothetical protein